MNNDIKGVVVLGYGPQPLTFLSKASKVCGEDAILDQDVARMAGANFAIGQPAALADLRQRLEAGAQIAQRVETPNLSMAAINWLSCGRRGLSSNALFSTLTGVNALGDDKPRHPHDPADLDRCLRLLNEVPELRPLLPKMADVSPQWAALIANWDEIERSHLDEAGLGWTKARSAPRTYELIKKAIESADTKEPV